jgi:hypothetical protein
MNVYEPLQPITCAGALEILERGDSDELLLLPLRIGEFISDWKTAQNLCLRLCRNDNPAIRANAVLGLSYIVRTCGKLDRELVEPVLTGELKDNETFRWRIMDAIDDINLYLGWNAAERIMAEYREDYLTDDSGDDGESVGTCG